MNTVMGTAESNSASKTLKRAIEKSTKITCKYLITKDNVTSTPKRKSFILGLENLVKIETIDGSVVRVTDKHFHGFSRIGQKEYQCYVCNEFFHECNVDHHRRSKTHTDNVMIPLKDKHCLRQIDESWNHCVICNVLIEKSDLNSIFHNSRHNRYLKEALLYEHLDESKSLQNNKLHTENFPMLYRKHNNISGKSSEDNFCTVEKQTAEILNLTVKATENIEGSVTFEIKTSNNADEKSLKSIDEPDKSFCPICNEHILRTNIHKHNNSKKHYFNSKSNSYYSKMVKKETDPELFCRVCNVVVPNNNKDFRKHDLDIEHVKKYYNILLHNKIKKISPNVFYCELCKDNVLSRNEFIHMYTKLHQLKFISIEFINDVFKENKMDKNESYKVAIKYYPCEVCHEEPNYDHKIEGHIKNHAKILKKRYDTCNTKQKKIQNFPCHIEKAEMRKFVRCKICDLNIPNIDSCISYHLSDPEHGMKYERILQNNLLKIKTFDIYCEVCEAFIRLNNELKHIIGKKHKGNVKKRNLDLVNDNVFILQSISHIEI